MISEIIAVIQAGGRGTRMDSLTGGVKPKPMLELCGKPIVLIQMETLATYGITDFIVITGYLGEEIEKYFGNGSHYGFSIQYIKEEKPLGSAGALYRLNQYPAKNYLLVFGDLIFDIDVNRMLSYHMEKGAVITLLSHPNSHPYDSDILCVDDVGKVTCILSKTDKDRGYYHNLVNSGIYIFGKHLLDKFESEKTMDMEKDVIIPLIRQGVVFSYFTTEYVKDSGTPERFETVKKDILSGQLKKRSIRNKRRCFFLDRDGTVNKYKGLITNADMMELEWGAAEAIKRINDSGCLAVIITNQPVIARGECNFEELDRIHRRLETLLGDQGAYIDALYYCPHHPDKGFPGERAEYKISCNCRKPKTGLIELAVDRFNIDVQSSYMIGDTLRDVMTGINAGLKTVLLRTGEGGTDLTFDVRPDLEAENLYEALNIIMKEDKSND